MSDYFTQYEQHVLMLSVRDEYNYLSPFLWTEDDPVFTRQDGNRSEKETTRRQPHETEPESGSQPRPAVLSGYFKQFPVFTTTVPMAAGNNKTILYCMCDLKGLLFSSEK